MARADAFANEASVMKALFQEYSKRDDLDAVAGVDRDLQEVLALCSQREADARTILRGGRWGCAGMAGGGPPETLPRYHTYMRKRARAQTTPRQSSSSYYYSQS